MASSRLVAGALAAVLIVAWAATPASAANVVPAWQAKVDPWVLETSSGLRQTEFLVFLNEQANLSAARLLKTKEARGQYVFERLTEVANRTQAGLLADLTTRGIEHRAFWVANMVWVRGNRDVVRQMAERPDVAHVYANPQTRLERPVYEEADVPEQVAGIEPNISHTGAPTNFWNAGFTGQGVTVAGEDTGYDWDHPALKAHYRGWNGISANHNYNWHDSIHSGGGVCGPNSPEPCDDDIHGTHTMGTIAGDDGGSNQIGMAPGAKWIGCRNMNQGFGTPASYTECFQFFIAPTDLSNQNPDPTKAPTVINNSWTCPPSEGCTDANALKTVVESVRAAGIVVVASAGNAGPGCSSVSDPPAIYDASFSVGATDNSDNIASFSSRGAVTRDGSNRLKPDISAPGVNVRSSIPNGGYTFLSGTSMAGPHVVGLVGLILSAAPCLVGDVDAIEAYVEATALPRTSSQTCNGVPGSQIPNNTYGYGAIRAVLPVGLCGPTLGGSATGVSASKAGCRDLTNPQGDFIIDVVNNAWDCELAGLGVQTGDSALMGVLGVAQSASVGGSVTRMVPATVTCLNKTTGQSVDIHPAGVSWDCQAGGLTIKVGDTILQKISGTVD